MGEAKQRKARTAAVRTWAMGSVTVIANKRRVLRLDRHPAGGHRSQKQYLDVINALGISARSYAVRAVGYLMVHGMPKAGDDDLRPSNYGRRWNQIDVDLYRHATLWLALREHIHGTEQRLEDVFVGKALVVSFDGDPERIIAESIAELRGVASFEGRKDVGHVAPGTPLPDDQFRMMAVVDDENYRLDPRFAVSMAFNDLLALAGRPVAPDNPADDLVYVPRMPLDATEAVAMLRMMTVFADVTDPSAGVRTYAGYTDDELRRGRPAVLVR